LPNKRLSYQFHNGRAETWVIIKGNARVTIEDVINDYSEGDTIVIPKRAKHRIQNISKKNLVFIEIQTGDYFDEDDIIRLEDDYNRIK
jgi:mannose-6-phosphate isomerase